MMKVSFAAAAVLLVTSSNAQCPSLLWNDEFNGTSLDSSKWTHQTGDGCELGPDLCGWGNAELQWYRPENTVVDGTLKIIAKKEAFNGKDYTSSRIRTLQKFDLDLTQDHVRIEARIKVADGGKGLWPAFWMLPSDRDATEWPTGGEIDIMEFIGREPQHAHGYIHYGNAFNDRVVKGGHLYTPDFVYEDFHEYAIEKKPGEISFFFDGHKYQTFVEADVEPKFTWPFENDVHLIMNVAVGGFWPENPDSTSSFPTQMEVDYVRVYDSSNDAYGHITGTRRVQAFTGDMSYCIEEGIEYESLSWSVPDGANFTTTLSNCISVDFGATSGYVAALGVSPCGERRFQVPVKVEPFYEKDFALVRPDAATDAGSLIFASGSYNLETVDGQPGIRYQRNIGEPYDTIQFSISPLANPNLYISEEHKFFMDLKTTTTPECTHVLVQLEDSTLVSDTNYPIGRHSRHIAYMSDSRDWQRLEFDFYDRPDLTTGTVDRITVLFDPNMAREDVYYIRNFDSDKTGCLANCESLPGNECRKRAKSEVGACTDGINNNGLGYDADGFIDCDDASCWDDPACLSTTPAPVTTPSPTTPAPTPLPVTPVPTPVTPAPVLSTPAPVAPAASCSANPQCAGLVGPDCCPTTDGVYLYCCEDFQPTGPAPTPALPPAPNAGDSCSSNPQCDRLNLKGDCCPTLDGYDLYCCEGYVPPVNDDPKCSAHASCVTLAGPDCCPTEDGTVLECCDNYVPPS